MEPWTTLRREPVFTHSKWVRVENHAIALPTGRTIERWPWIICPDYVNVAVIDIEGMLLCFRQTKYAVEGVALAPCGGYLEPNEDPLEAARRELREEMGYTAPRWTSLGVYAVDGNHGAGRAHLFLAQDAIFEGKSASDDLEEQELVRLSRVEAAQALAGGQFKVLSWSATMAMALLASGGC